MSLLSEIVSCGDMGGKIKLSQIDRMYIATKKGKEFGDVKLNMDECAHYMHLNQ